MASRFIQIHTLTPYAATLLNRDDAGFAKRLPFGGVTRTRVSSQCLKRHWRTFSGEGGLGQLELPGTIRSRRTFEQYVVAPLVADGEDESAVRAITEAMMQLVLGESAKAKAEKETEEEGDKTTKLHTSQVTVLGEPELRFLRDLIGTLSSGLSGEGKKLEKEASERVKKGLDKDAKANLKQMTLAGGVGSALFGRMVTSDILARSDAAIHVAHAFTVHEQDSEDDYFSAVDELVQQAGEQGSGHINSSELTSGIYYGYVVVDVPLLVSNLTGCEADKWESENREVAADIVSRLVHLVSTVSPGAKLGSTAPYSRAQLVVAEAGAQQPRSLANAFLEPVSTRGEILRATYRKLAQHVVEIDRMYSWGGGRVYAAVGPQDELGAIGENKATLDEVRRWVFDQIAGDN